MKTIGLIGGMSWESTAVYYRRLNEQVRKLCGGLHSAEIVMRSVDFESIVAMQTAGDWDGAAIVAVAMMASQRLHFMVRVVMTCGSFLPIFRMLSGARCSRFFRSVSVRSVLQEFSRDAPGQNAISMTSGSQGTLSSRLP